MQSKLRLMYQCYERVLRGAVLVFAAVASVGILAMMVVTVCDILVRRLGQRPLRGAMDIIQMAGAVTIAGALPYTTAVKGHVAVEFLVQRLNRFGRIAVDTVARSLAIGLFGVLSHGCFKRGEQLRRVGEVSLILEWPTFWVLHVLGVSCALAVLVILHNMLHPGREMIKP